MDKNWAPKGPPNLPFLDIKYITIRWKISCRAHSARKLEDALHVETGAEVQVDILDPVHYVHCVTCSGPKVIMTNPFPLETPSRNHGLVGGLTHVYTYLGSFSGYFSYWGDGIH